jgi:trk system potassium uptake protein TrkH
LIQNVDHIPISLNIWRHVLTFIGGQGVILVALSFVPPAAVGFQALVGEGKEEKLIPSIKETSQAIWFISFFFMIVGICIYFIIGLLIGLEPGWSLFHGICMFLSSWSAGGFAPQTMNVLYYHNFLIEFACMVFMILGTMNFGLHYYIWFKDRKELYKDIETKSFMITLGITSVLLTIGLLKDQIYTTLFPLFRKGFFLLISGHTTTGQMTIYSTQFLTQWGDVGLIAVILVMIFGGWSASTAGGFKAIRIGIVFKSIISDIHQFLIPRTSVYVSKYRHLTDRILNSKTIKTTMNIIALYMIFHLLGAVVGVLNGYPLVDSFFESVSATANVGLSCGITSFTMPFNMKVVYITNMYLGRLEFTAAIVLISYIVNGAYRRRHKESKTL